MSFHLILLIRCLTQIYHTCLFEYFVDINLVNYTDETIKLNETFN